MGKTETEQKEGKNTWKGGPEKECEIFCGLGLDTLFLLTLNFLNLITVKNNTK
jgi:hypothetical protein